MKKSILLTSIIMMLVTISFGQVSTSSTGRVSEIKTDFVFNLVDGQFNKPLFRSGWLSDVGDYISIKHGGNNTEAATYGFRISDAQGFNFGKNDFNTSFLKIKPNGYVGIGYSNPASPLHIVSNYDGIMTLQTSDDSWLYTNWKDKNGTRKAYVGFDSSLTNFRINLENGADRFTVNGANVGIGTYSPAAKLHVVGDGVRASNFSIESINDRTNDSPWYGLGRGNFTDLSNDNVKTSVQLAGYYGLLLKTAAGSLGIHQNGNVGIGTTNPQSKFVVKNGGQTINFSSGTNSSGYALDVGVNDDGINLYNNSTVRGFNFKNINGTLMKIVHNGNVGIGTTNPDAKLTVKGNIHTQEVKVDLNGAVAPDYVLLDNYNLKTINEVEAYIKDQGHLPNIPSAAEMEQNGIELKQMNLNLLEKIEELTLYTIAQEKRIKELESRDVKIKTLEEKIELLLKGK
ncbi:hypothetical protein [Aquimarina sp. LLG6339-5]|uniref:hypothetical protein n=1 Tax=Aquimarina sp. LLG6339-5 TaxID=3160830 RepID=UPI0038674229